MEMLNAPVFCKVSSCHTHVYRTSGVIVSVSTIKLPLQHHPPMRPRQLALFPRRRTL